VNRGPTLSSQTIELLKIFGSFLGAIIGAVGAISLKEYLDRRSSRHKEYQTRWLPFSIAVRELKERFDDLTSIYKHPSPPYSWGTLKWKDSTGDEHVFPLESRDFHELYLLDINSSPIYNFGELSVDPGERREDEHAVQKVRERIHELNRATTSLYRTAKYLGYAQRVLKELMLDQLTIAESRREEMTKAILYVRTELNGTSPQNPGAGIIDDLQDLIGESMWGPDNSVISYYEFRERLLNPKGWEQFTDLYRFFVSFHFKLDTEVKKTREALALLAAALERAVGPRQTIRFSPKGYRRTE
jgi:hypothetical protein